MSSLPRAIYDGTATCATCALWIQDPEQLPLLPPDSTAGTCHAEPPRMSGMLTWAIWPHVKGCERACGKFALAGDVELEKRK